MKEYKLAFLQSFPQIGNPGYLYMETNDNELIHAAYDSIRRYAEDNGIAEKLFEEKIFAEEEK